MKRSITLFLPLLLFVLLVGCGTSAPKPTPEPTPAIRSATMAISTVKGSKGENNYTSQRIRSELGFKFWYEPDYGTCNAKENADGSWDVTLYGKMNGYTDDYKSDFAIKKFTVSATVSKDGSFRVSVKEVD